MLTLSEMERSKKAIMNKLEEMRVGCISENKQPTGDERFIATALLDYVDRLELKMNYIYCSSGSSSFGINRAKFNNKKNQKEVIKYENTHCDA